MDAGMENGASAYRASLVRRFNWTVDSIASMRSFQLAIALSRAAGELPLMADNFTVLNSAGSTVTFRSTDVGAGIECSMSIPSNPLGSVADWLRPVGRAHYGPARR